MKVAGLFLLLLPGTCWSAYVPGQIIYKEATPQEGDTLTSTTNTTFASFGTIPAGVLTPGHAVRLEVGGSGSSMPGGGTITFQLQLGGTVIWTSQAYTTDNTIWYLIDEIHCTAAGTIRQTLRHGCGPGSGNFTASSGTSATTTGLTLTNANNLQLFVQFSATGNTVTQNDHVVRYDY